MARIVPFRDGEQESEWLGGRYTLPHHVRDGDTVFRLQAILWLELPRGVLVGSTLVSPEKPVSLAESLDAAMRQPAEGSPRRPSRIRVADRRTSEELRAAAAGIPIVVAPVPELDAVFEELSDALDETTNDSYLGDGDVQPRAVEELFKAASLLFRAAPWQHMTDRQILRADIPRFGIAGACLSVIGATGEKSGLLLFSSLRDYHAFFSTPQEAAPDGRLVMRSLTFYSKDDLPPSLLREAEQHRWPVAGTNAYPFLLNAAADMEPMAVTEQDVRILTAVTRAFVVFFLRHRDLFDGDDPEPVRESSEGEDGVKVTLTAPYRVSADLSFRTAAPPPRAVGRNEPCPCGSGRKYKKCHLDADQAPRRTAAEVETVHDMDFRIVEAMARFVSDGFTFEWFGIVPEDENRDALDLIRPWAAWTAEVNRRSVADAFLEQHASRLSPEERDWFAAQQAAWLSVWEVISVAPGEVEVRDLLTGATRTVREELASRTLRPRDSLLARVVDYRGVSYFGGMYSRSLPPAAAARVIGAVRAKLRLRKAAVPPERLRGRKIGWFLIDHWSAAVEDRFVPPALHNMDGDPLQLVTDLFRFDGALRAEIERRLEAMDDFGSASSEGGQRVHVFVRAADDTVTGVVRVGDGTLRIETNSENRADALARRVEEACAGLLERQQRTIDPFPSPDGASVEPPGERDAEEQTLVREVKENHYRHWLETPLPVLGGKTPRAAARSVKLRRKLDLILRDIENIESRAPEAERFNVTHLRRELGLEP